MSKTKSKPVTYHVMKDRYWEIREDGPNYFLWRAEKFGSLELARNFRQLLARQVGKSDRFPRGTIFRIMRVDVVEMEEDWKPRKTTLTPAKRIASCKELIKLHTDRRK